MIFEKNHQHQIFGVAGHPHQPIAIVRRRININQRQRHPLHQHRHRHHRRQRHRWVQWLVSLFFLSFTHTFLVGDSKWFALKSNPQYIVI